VALVPLGFVGLLSVMICSGGCSNTQLAFVTLMTISPLFMLVAVMSGIAVFRSPTWGLAALTIVPSLLTLIGFAGVGSETARTSASHPKPTFTTALAM
jgi:hypothetical protein